MARNREKTGSLTKQIQNVYDSKLAIGDSKNYDKSHDGIKDKIYSWSTYNGYMKHANYFAKYCKETHGSRTLEECKSHINEWIEKRSNLSASTQKLETAALAKLYGCSTKDFNSTPARKRADITRSRGEKVRDKHFSETKNKPLVDFCKVTGLRRAELKALTGDKYFEKDGKHYVSVDSGAKNGRPRDVEIIGTKQAVTDAVNHMKAAGDGKVFEKIPNGADIHSYRRDYCTEVYNIHARDLSTLGQREIYYCRGDRKGQWYDKEAMQKASEALGHNRISVIAGHYLK